MAIHIFLFFFTMPKPIHKDAQLTIRVNKETLEAIKKDAADRNISMADFILGLYQDCKNKQNTESRLKALERAVFQSSSVA